MSFPPQLDHIIILVPYSTLASIPKSISSAFHVSAGGRHADNKTENRLIILRDGVYLELIAFINDDPELKKGHWWGELPNGIIDFAFTSKDVDDLTTPGGVKDRLDKVKGGLGVGYDEPKAGGRKRPDGKEVKWFVTFPRGLKEHETVRRGSVPFWCHDVTDRELRVPAHDTTATTHPSNAVGVKEVVLGVSKSKLPEFSKTYAAISGSEDEKTESGDSSYVVGTPFAGERSAKVSLEALEGDEARVLKLVVGTTGETHERPEDIDEAFGGGNKIKIQFSSGP